MIVFAFCKASEKSFVLAGPMSRAIQLSGISWKVTTFVSALPSNFSAITKSTGKYTLTPLSLASLVIDEIFSIMAFSIVDLPAPYPSALRKGKAIAPPIINLSTFFERFSIIFILSETFAPPIMATRGLDGLLTAFSK